MLVCSQDVLDSTGERLEDLPLSKRKAFAKKFSWSHGCKIDIIIYCIVGSFCEAKRLSFCSQDFKKESILTTKLLFARVCCL